jgi:endonuclease III
MSQSEMIKILLKKLGQKFSSSLNIELSSVHGESADSEEVFKWFLASILFGARISETIVINTYREFEKERVLSAEKIPTTGWDGLVKILDDGGYVRYDFKTATKLLEIMARLKELYKGDLNKLHMEAKDSSDLENRLKNLGRGIGDVTVNIFLRELRGIWQKADPLPSDLVILSARNLGLLSPPPKAGFSTKIRSKKEILNELKSVYHKNKIKGKDFVDFEAALLRLGKDFCRKGKCEICVVENFCKSRS